MEELSVQSPLTEAHFTEFPVKSPENFNFANDVVDRWAAFDRNKMAMIWVNQQGEEKRFTFFDFSRLSNQAANLLLKQGIGAGDRVFLMLPRLPEWWIFSLALIRIGAIQCPSPTLLTPPDIKQRINAGKFKMVITDNENAPKFDEVFDDCPSLNSRLIVNDRRPGWISYLDRSNLSTREIKLSKKYKSKSSDPFLILFTSGTSKMPKMVEHSNDYALGHRITAELWHEEGANDLAFTVSDRYEEEGG